MQTNTITRQELTAVSTPDALRLVLQPIVSCKTGLISGFEALARLGTNNQSPLEFLPKLYAQYGRPELVSHIASEAIEGYRQTLKLIGNAGVGDIGKTPYLAINLEPEDLNSSETIDALFATLAEKKFSAALFRVEITEHCQLHLNPEVLHNIGRLYSRGVSIAIDDFGSGFSAMAMLSQITFDCVKLDRSFVKDLSHNPRSKHLLYRLCSLLGDLDTCIVAEGVEDAATARLLKAAGCNHLQGYYFSRPQEPRALASHILKQHQEWTVTSTPEPANTSPSANAFFDNALDMLCIISFEGYLLRVNQAFSRQLGWHSRELTNKHFSQFTHAEDVDRTVEQLQQLAQGGRLPSLKIRLLKADQSYCAVEWTAAPDLTRRTAYAIARQEDIPARVQKIGLPT